MNESNKPKRKVAERRPAGIKAMPAPPPRTLPDDHPARSLFKEVARDEAAPAAATATPATLTTATTATTPTTLTTPTTPIAPTRDFMRVANSIVRDALPSGFFTGKRKQIYDYLYSVTRGAIVPTRTVRITMETLAIKADVGSDRTLRKHLRRLVEVGLLYVNEIGGTQGGNEFTVLIPEEITPTTYTTTTPTTPHHVYHQSPNVPVVQVVESDSGRGGLFVDSEATSGPSKTSFKTNTERSDDDEAFGRLRLAMKEATGREVSVAALAEVDELLAMEFGIAAARTTVSSAPAFLAEHLRRRLFKKDRRQLAAEAASAPATEALPADVDVKTCPDCHGAGFWYPEGFEKGVARCAHEKLLKAEGEA